MRDAVIEPVIDLSMQEQAEIITSYSPSCFENPQKEVVCA